jgi:excisionase family DNA binding protein
MTAAVETPPQAPLLVTIPEAARLLACSVSLVKLMIRRGDLAAVKVGRLTRLHHAQLIQRFSPPEIFGGDPHCCPPRSTPEFASPPVRHRVGSRRRSGHASW